MRIADLNRSPFHRWIPGRLPRHIVSLECGIVSVALGRVVVNVTSGLDSEKLERQPERRPERCNMTTSEEVTSKEVTVKSFDAGDSKIALFEFQGLLREQMVSSLRNSYLATGSYVTGAKAISSQGALSMAVAGAATGATALSAALSSTLYMATADPSTLMKLGEGVGSAVMGATGIAGQAPFMAVASSLPIVGPILAIQALSTAVMLNQFQKVDRKLDDIKSALDKAVVRSEVTQIAKLLTASSILDEVYQQYEQAGSFSSDMLIRLALVEHDVRSLSERFRSLVATHESTQVQDIDANLANADANSAMLASFLDLRIAYLRVCVDMQENPKSVESSVGQLKGKLGAESDFWQELLNRSDRFAEAKARCEAELENMNGVQRTLSGLQRSSIEKKLRVAEVAYTVTLESEKAIMKGFDSLIGSATEVLSALENPMASPGSSPILVYWKDETGEHSFSTDSPEILRLSGS